MAVSCRSSRRSPRSARRSTSPSPRSRSRPSSRPTTRPRAGSLLLDGEGDRHGLALAGAVLALQLEPVAPGLEFPAVERDLLLAGLVVMGEALDRLVAVLRLGFDRERGRRRRARPVADGGLGLELLRRDG